MDGRFIVLGFGRSITAVDPVWQAVIDFLSADGSGWQDLDHRTVSEAQQLALNRLASARFLAIRQTVVATYREHTVTAEFRCLGDLWRKRLGQELKSRLRSIQPGVEWAAQQRLAGYKLTLDGELLRKKVNSGETPVGLIDMLDRSDAYESLLFSPEVSCETWQHHTGPGVGNSAVAAAQAIASPTINNEIHVVTEAAVVAPKAGTEPATPTRGTKGQPAKKSGFTDSELKVLAALQAHHMESSETLESASIATVAKVSAPTVSRFLTKHLGGRPGYEGLCRRDEIQGRLAILAGDGTAFGTADPQDLDF